MNPTAAHPEVDIPVALIHAHLIDRIEKGDLSKLSSCVDEDIAAQAARMSTEMFSIVYLLGIAGGLCESGQPCDMRQVAAGLMSMVKFARVAAPKGAGHA